MSSVSNIRLWKDYCKGLIFCRLRTRYHIICGEYCHDLFCLWTKWTERDQLIVIVTVGTQYVEEGGVETAEEAVAFLSIDASWCVWSVVGIVIVVHMHVISAYGWHDFFFC